MLTTVLLLGILISLLAVIFRMSSHRRRGSDQLAVIARICSVFRRFPFAVATSAAGTVAGVVLVEKAYLSPQLQKLLAVALLLQPLLVGSKLLAEKKGREDSRPDPLTVTIFILGCAYFIFGEFHSYSIWYRHTLWTVAAFLTLLVIPFHNLSEEQDWWHFIASMAQAFAIAFISALALFAGISAALAGVDYLLAVKVPADAYMRLWVVMAGFVAVVVFLSALPADIRRVSSPIDQSRLYQGFIRFILVPLIALYLIILYIYAGRIIIQGSWPKGGVAGFILGFSGVGIATYLLNYGTTATENRLQSLFRKFFFPLVLPLTPMLFLSVWRRVSDYGVTETRYFGILSSLWLAGICLYYILSRRKDLRVVPASLCIIVLLISFGPWGVLSTSARSQTVRLKKLLEGSGILVNGVLHKPTDLNKLKGLGEIHSALAYLRKTDNLAPLAAWSGGKITTKDKPETIAVKMGIPSFLEGNGLETNFSFYAAQEDGADVSGYNSVWQISFYRHELQEISRNVNSACVLKVKPENGLQKLRISFMDKQSQVAEVDLASFAEALLKDYPVKSAHRSMPRQSLVMDVPGGRARVAVSQMYGSITGGKPVVNSITGVLMWRQ